MVQITGRLFILYKLDSPVIHITSTMADKLDYSCMGLTELPKLPEGLVELRCHGNRLTVLPELPSSLTKLHCQYNRLTVLPELPPSLTELYCYNNRLTAIPELPVSITTLHCQYNRLSMLPELPPSLTKLYCDENQLVVLPELPTGLIELCYGRNWLDSSAYMTYQKFPSLFEICSFHHTECTVADITERTQLCRGCMRTGILRDIIKLHGSETCPVLYKRCYMCTEYLVSELRKVDLYNPIIQDV